MKRTRSLTALVRVGWDVISEALTIVQDKGIEEDKPSNAIAIASATLAITVPYETMS